MKLLLASATILGLLALTSCNSNDGEDKPVTQQSLMNYFNIVTDIATGEVTYVQDVSYSVTYDYSTAKAIITLSGVKLPDSSGTPVAFPTLTTDELTWTGTADDWKKISVASVATSAQNLGNTPVLQNFTFNLKDNWIGDEGYFAYTGISYDINGYHVLSLPRYMMSSGTTKSALVGTGYVFETDETIYLIEFTPGSDKVNLTINNMTVVDGNTFRAVAINNLPVTITPAGDIYLSAEACSAVVVGSPVPDESKMPVTNLTMSIENNVLTLSYNIVIDNTHYQVSVN